ncbi:DUF4181 domain-containing protein [Rossellomorea sp. NS-SX7]|uniref:DUF4181 domain-containing protein n=1 Tax=Rossellomorea sp. NS-SX7 TaxID=3463856 RepID=UPI00405839E7
MLSFIIYLAAFIAVYFIVERAVRKKWNIPNNRKTGIQGVNSIHKWGLRIGWAVFFVSIVTDSSGLFTASIIIMIWAFDAFMEWKYNKAEREYLITLLGLGFFITFIAAIYTFEWLT